MVGSTWTPMQTSLYTYILYSYICIYMHIYKYVQLLYKIDNRDSAILQKWSSNFVIQHHAFVRWWWVGELVRRHVTMTNALMSTRLKSIAVFLMACEMQFLLIIFSFSLIIHYSILLWALTSCVTDFLAVVAKSEKTNRNFRHQKKKYYLQQTNLFA